jgi:predicted aspartyl protease
MEGKHLVITCTLTVNNQEKTTHVLIDSGATGVALMDQNFARHHQTPLEALKENHRLM